MEIFGVFLVNQSSGITTPLYHDKDNIIGRGIPQPEGEEGQVLLPHPSISKLHAKIRLSPETHQWILYDTSRHGILVNDNRVEKQAILGHGDKIKVGPFVLMFYEKFKADDQTSEQPLPLFDDAVAAKNFWWYCIGLLIIEVILLSVSPKLLVALASAVCFFLLATSLRSKWVKKLGLSYPGIFLLLALAIFGAGFSIYILVS